MDSKEAELLINSLKSKNILKSGGYLNQKNQIQSKLIFGSKDAIKDAVITIVIPAYRRPDLFEKALYSALNQEKAIPYKILITDDSEEIACENEKIVKKYNDRRVIYYKNEKALGWYNWNRLLELADTPWICMLHDDDILYKKYIYYMSRLLNKVEDADMITCERVIFRNNNAEIAINEGNLKYIIPQKLKLKKINFQFASFMLGALIKRDKAIEIGGFNDNIISLDYEFIARMVIAGNVYSCPLSIYGYGVKNNESTKSDMWEKMIISEYYICRSICDFRNILIRGIARKVEDFSIANHIEDMSSSENNIYGVEIDYQRMCSWLQINYKIKDSFWMRLFRKILV